MKFGIVVTKEYPAARELGGKVSKYLVSRGHEVLETNLTRSEVVVTLGGDGTLIHAACEHIEVSAPFFGINAGTLGFLTACERSEWKEAVDKIIKGDYVISERMTLEAGIEKSGKAHPRGVFQVSPKLHLAGEGSGSYRALNEVVVKGMYRVIDLEVVVNGQKFLDISGDGVIISTPTGSTAYSLSAGGPIVDPELDSLLVTPISAVGLPIPSVVLSADDVVEINVKAGDDMSLIIDGQEHTKVTEGQVVCVVNGKYRVKFGYFDKHHFLKALNAKFGLSLRPFKVQGKQAQGKTRGLAQ